MAEQRSAAQSLYPHLPSAARPEVQQRRTASLSDSLWPQLSREQKARDAWQAKWEAEQKERNRRMAEHLRQINERLAREKR
jgi:hypothetical protein